MRREEIELPWRKTSESIEQYVIGNTMVEIGIFSCERYVCKYVQHESQLEISTY